jgi:hypothetical protein
MPKKRGDQHNLMALESRLRNRPRDAVGTICDRRIAAPIFNEACGLLRSVAGYWIACRATPDSFCPVQRGTRGGTGFNCVFDADILFGILRRTAILEPVPVGRRRDATPSAAQLIISSGNDVLGFGLDVSSSPVSDRALRGWMAVRAAEANPFERHHLVNGHRDTG